VSIYNYINPKEKAFDNQEALPKPSQEMLSAALNLLN